MLPLEISACQYFGKQAVPDPDLVVLEQKIFRPFGPQFGLQIRGAAPPPPGSSPGSATEQGTNARCLPHIRESVRNAGNLTCEIGNHGLWNP